MTNEGGKIIDLDFFFIEITLIIIQTLLRSEKLS